MKKNKKKRMRSSSLGWWKIFSRLWVLKVNEEYINILVDWVW